MNLNSPSPIYKLKTIRLLYIILDLKIYVNFVKSYKNIIILLAN